MSVMKIEDLAVLIKSIARRGMALDKDIQKAAVAAVAFSIIDRNSTPANDLFKALAKSHRRDKLAMYFEKFGNLAYMKTTDSIDFFDVAAMTGKPALEYTDELELELLTTPWTGTTKAPVVSAYDVEDAIAKFFKSADKAVKENRVENELGIGLLKSMHNAYAAWLVANQQNELDADDTIVLHEGDLIDVELIEDESGRQLMVVNG